MAEVKESLFQKRFKTVPWREHIWAPNLPLGLNQVEVKTCMYLPACSENGWEESEKG
jgi:hypothetical protein